MRKPHAAAAAARSSTVVVAAACAFVHDVKYDYNIGLFPQPTRANHRFNCTTTMGAS